MGDPISELNTVYEHFFLDVKVLRKWRKREESEFNGEIIFADYACDKVQATIPEKLVDEFYFYINEGDCVYLEGFKVVKETRSFLNTKHEYRILFTQQTKVRPSTRYDNDDYYSFEDFEDILTQKICECNHAIDLYGMITSVEPMVICTDNPYEEFAGEEVRMVSFKICNINGHQLECIALNELADKLGAVWEDQLPFPLVCVLRFWRLTYKEGVPVICSGKKVSDLVFEPEIDEVSELKQIFENVSDYDEDD